MLTPATVSPELALVAATLRPLITALGDYARATEAKDAARMSRLVRLALYATDPGTREARWKRAA